MKQDTLGEIYEIPHKTSKLNKLLFEFPRTPLSNSEESAKRQEKHKKQSIDVQSEKVKTGCFGSDESLPSQRNPISSRNAKIQP